MNGNNPITPTADPTPEVAARAAQAWESTKEKAVEQTQAVASRAAEAWDTSKEKVGAALQSGETYVREHPGISVLGIFTFGVLVGVVVGWTMAHEQQDDYTTSARQFLKRLGHKLNLD